MEMDGPATLPSCAFTSTNLAREPVEPEFGGREMTAEVLRQLTDAEPGCYETPDLNEKLYLSRRGFRRIENLEPYTNVVALFLDSNGLRTIENIGHLTNLRMLYLDSNCIERVEGLGTLTELQTLNLSNNCLTTVEGLEGLTKLETLSVSRNKICSLDALSGVRAAPLISSLDVSYNNIEDTEGVPEAVHSLAPALTVLCFHHNPNKRKLPNYRRGFIAAIPKLVYLDDRTVNELERKTSEAWAQGLSRSEVDGVRIAYNVEKQAKDRQSFEAFLEVQAARAAEVQRQRSGEEPSEQDPDAPLGASSVPIPLVKLRPGERSADAQEAEDLAKGLLTLWYGDRRTKPEEPVEEPPAAAQNVPSSPTGQPLSDLDRLD
jgi:dynein assembly factor 1